MRSSGSAVVRDVLYAALMRNEGSRCGSTRNAESLGPISGRDTFIDDKTEVAEYFTALSEQHSEDNGGIEIRIVREHDWRGRGSRWRALEVWTRNSVYGVDTSFTCIEVMDRCTRCLDTGHALIGATLLGGWREHSEGVSLSGPFPLRGMQAMFLNQEGHVFTSVVERVSLRVRVGSPAGAVEEAWPIRAPRCQW
jgi:hypothetical protein